MCEYCVDLLARTWHKTCSLQEVAYYVAGVQRNDRDRPLNDIVIADCGKYTEDDEDEL